MNFTKLRRLAESLTVGQPYVAYLPLKPTVTRKGSFAGQVKLSPACTRAAYQDLKKKQKKQKKT